MWYPVVDLRLVAHFFTHRLAILSDYSCYVDDIEAKGKEKGIEERPNPCKYHVYVDSSLRERMLFKSEFDQEDHPMHESRPRDGWSYLHGRVVTVILVTTVIESL